MAARLFAERGFHGVSVGDIGKAVGVSGPALYKHFDSKDAVLAEMLVAISERLLAEGQRAGGARRRTRRRRWPRSSTGTWSSRSPSRP